MVQFGQRQGELLIAEISEVFAKGSISETRDRHVVFVCGGPRDGEPRSLRSRFLEWAGAHLPSVVVLSAEDAYNEASSTEPLRLINISDFENLLGDVSDCILVFPESAGSYAEIGFFSKTSAKVRNKVLVATPRAYFNRDSFINLGPVEFINHKRSRFSPAIPVSDTELEIDFQAIASRITDRLRHRKYRKKLSRGRFARMNFSEKLMVVLAMVMLFRATTIDGLEHTVRKIFEAASKVHIGHALSILIAAGWVKKTGDYYVPLSSATSILEYDDVRPFTSVAVLNARVAYYHQKNDPEAYSCLSEIR